jgi:hypothetical protein
VLPSTASPLRPDKATFLRRVPLADNVGTRGGGRGATGSSRTGAGGGGLGAGLGGLDGWPRRRPPRGAGEWRGRLNGDLDATQASSTERLSGDLHTV